MHLFEKHKKRFYILLVFGVLFGKPPFQEKIIKHYHVAVSDEEQVNELTGMAHVFYSKSGAILDSTNYSFIVPLSEKYAYINGKQEGLQLLRKMDKEVINRYVYNYNLNGALDHLTCYIKDDKIQWKEFYKYSPDGLLIKSIRFNPDKAKPKSKPSLSKKSTWGEVFVYDTTGSIMTHEEYYDEYLIEKHTYRLDKKNNSSHLHEYYDPSFIQKTEYKYNELGKVHHKLVVENRGVSVKSITYDYDGFGRLNKTISFNEDGLVQDSTIWSYKKEQTISVQYNDMGYIHRRHMREYSSDQKLLHKIDYDGVGNVLFKQAFSYSKEGLLNMVRSFDPHHPNRTNDIIPLNVSIFEYD